jgi:hypothetical protein|tara:strand:- start:361 stop:810 length:450 start_codon:yes stop_codon:yes gene_type:complete
MGTTSFSGPIKAGTIATTTGTTVGTDMKNVGFVVMAQSEAITEAATSASTDMIIPANSQIIDIKCLVTTVWDGGTNTLDVGDGSTTDLYVNGMVMTAAGLVNMTAATTGTGANWRDVGTSDVRISVDSVATGSGVGVLTVWYIQNINLT